MRKRFVGGAVAAAVAAGAVGVSSGLAAGGAPDPAPNWTVNGAPVRAQIKGGPWTLAQGILGNTATGTPMVGSYPNDYTLPLQPTNDGATNNMSPYYFPYVAAGSGGKLMGFFDYRPRSAMESVVSATSRDGGLTWRYTGEALRYMPSSNFQFQFPPNTPSQAGANLFANGSDDGQGHPFTLSVDGSTYLYTLNRTAGKIDVADLLVHRLHTGRASHFNPLVGQPAIETPAGTSSLAKTTVGLAGADGIIGAVRGPHNSYRVMWVKKTLGAGATGGYNTDTTSVFLSTTTDGIHFTGATPVCGLNTSTDCATSWVNDTSGNFATKVPSTETRWVTSRGTLVTFHRGAHPSYGLFFSGGLYTDQDSDAFHYVGYATSTDLVHWTMVDGISKTRGLNNPLLSVSSVNPGFQNQDQSYANGNFYSGRVYDPNVIIGQNGKTATMIFAGYNTGKPKNHQADYRQIGVVRLTLAK